MDSEEIDKWDEESERAWKDDAHDIEFAESIVGLLKEILPPNARILDVGCGIGKHVKAFRKLGYTVVGIDQSKKAIEYAKILNPDTDLRNIRIQQLYSHDEFDLIHTCAVLQHSIHQRQIDMLHTFYNALKPNGYYLCAECTLPPGASSDGYSFTYVGWLTFMDANNFKHVKTIPPWPYYLYRVNK